MTRQFRFQFCISLAVLSLMLVFIYETLQQRYVGNATFTPNFTFTKDEPVKIHFARFDETPIVAPVQFDLKEIKKRKKLIALTGYNTTSYFIYKGSPMGFEYDLLAMFAKEIGVELEMVVVRDNMEMIRMLNNGEGDIIANHLIVTKDKEELVNFTTSVSQTRQVLVQRAHKQEKKLLRNPINLIGKEIFVTKNSPYSLRLKNLSQEIGGDIKIAEVSGFIDEEALMAQVAEGGISYTVADESLALISRSYYTNLDVETAIGFPQRVAWAVRENSPQLLEAVNNWLTSVKKESLYKDLYHKYYLNKKNGERFVKHRVDLQKKQQISKFDKMIVRYARELGWDWRLLASLIYQESRFDPTAKSWVGASGLMQLMPATAKNFGIENLEDPEQSLKAGIAYIKWLDKYWKKKVPEKTERIKFIMASYNVGQEHISDAQRLALKYKKDPSKWEGNVAYFILHKSNPKYCNDPVVKFGYCRGRETYDYVNDVFRRFHHYKNLVRENA